MRRTGIIQRGVTLLLAANLSLGGCATTVPYTGAGPHPQIERGQPVPVIDFLGNVLALPFKLLLWSWKFDIHYVSPDVETELVEYLAAQSGDLPALQDTKFRLNQYRPGNDLSRLIKNKHVKWPYRVLLGIPTTLIVDVLLPGRLFPWGDYYNPFTNTVHAYSDHPAIVLHEAGHAHDFATRRYKGTYALARIIPGVDLYQEYKASDEAIDYFIEVQDHPKEFKAYKILYPAFGTYAGRYIIWPFGYAFVIVGHIFGRTTAKERENYYQRVGAPAVSPVITPIPPVDTPAPEPSTL